MQYQYQGNGLMTGNQSAGQILGTGAAKFDERKIAYVEPNPAGLVAITAENVYGRASRLHEIATRLARVADRIYGAQPETSDKAQTAPSRDADADKLHFAMELLDGALERSEAALARVEKL